MRGKDYLQVAVACGELIRDTGSGEEATKAPEKRAFSSR